MPHRLTRTPPRTLLLDPLPREVRQRLLQRGHRKHYATGQEIFATGTKGDTAFLIETGRVRIKLTSEEGRRTVLSNLGPGDVVGELAALDGGVRSADAEAASDVTGTLIGRSALIGLLQEHPVAAFGVIAALCDRLRNTNEAYASQVLASGKARLARVLTQLFDRWGADDNGVTRLLGSFSQSELGDMSGMTRESTNRLLRRLENDGILSRDQTGSLLLHDAQALSEIAFATE